MAEDSGFTRGYEKITPSGEVLKGAPSTEKANEGISRPGPAWGKGQGK